MDPIPLTIKGRGPMTGYDRGRFGAAWADVNRNACDTRDDILRRDLRHYSRRPHRDHQLSRSDALCADRGQ